MTDREMLELAANAAASAGMPIIPSEAGPQIMVRRTSDGTEFYRIWAPRDDDGDSRRLAVALDINVHTDGDCVYHNDKIVAYNPPDMCTAVRLAVLQAAAEIGKAMG